MAEKAKIYYQDKSNELKGEIEVMFNPASYSISRSVNYSNKNEEKERSEGNKTTSANLDNHPNMNYLGGNSDTLTLELIINKYNFSHYSGDEKYDKSKLDITQDVKKLEALTFIKSELHKPPLCKFVWSSFTFEGYVTSFSANFTMFLDDGTPVRAKVNLTIQGGNNIKVAFESPDRTKDRIIKENQQLYEIAYEEYGDASKWREIAKANNISNPLYISTGTHLVVPAIK
jgi:hypothetical protein